MVVWQRPMGLHYENVLKPGEETADLFEEVSALQSADVEKLKNFELIVYGEAINAESGGF